MANLKIIFLFRWFHEIRLTRCCNPERFNSKYAFRFTTSLRFKHINTETAVKKPTSAYIYVVSAWTKDRLRNAPDDSSCALFKDGRRLLRHH